MPGGGSHASDLANLASSPSLDTITLTGCLWGRLANCVRLKIEAWTLSLVTRDKLCLVGKVLASGLGACNFIHGAFTLVHFCEYGSMCFGALGLNDVMY